jgi:nitrogen fixation protein FixH
MKINWGTALVIGMALFISFILYFVYRISTENNLDHDLVTESYYQKEMELQDNIYAQQNTAAMKNKITGIKNDMGYLLQFPRDYDPAKIKGKVFLYRPSNKQLDFELPLELTDPNLLIPDNRLVDGRWNITINWEYEGKQFKFVKEITY